MSSGKILSSQDAHWYDVLSRERSSFSSSGTVESIVNDTGIVMMCNAHNLSPDKSLECYGPEIDAVSLSFLLPLV
jgi:hypothetical protein